MYTLRNAISYFFNDPNAVPWGFSSYNKGWKRTKTVPFLNALRHKGPSDTKGQKWMVTAKPFSEMTLEWYKSLVHTFR